MRIVRSDNKESNTAIFEVEGIGGSSAGGSSYNYPNPFNPSSSNPVENKTTIVFDAGSAKNISVYIFDISARLVKKIDWAGGAGTVTWDGKNGFGEVLGDGVYLYRVINNEGKSQLGKGKILIIHQ